MAVWITFDSTGGVSTLRIEGRLMCEDLAALRAAYEGHPGPLSLELSNLQFADRESIGVLRGLLRDRAELVGVGPYLDLLLQPDRPERGGERIPEP